jgi:hypothetical protein
LEKFREILGISGLLGIFGNFREISGEKKIKKPSYLKTREKKPKTKKTS